VLDIGLPKMDGLQVCRTLRTSDQTPIIFLTAREDEIDRVLGLELGGDDYVTKPFSPRELVARVRTVLKRTDGGPISSGVLQRGDLMVEAAKHSCLLNGAPVALTAREMALLAHLMERPDMVSSRPQMTDAMYGRLCQCD